jgi:hypothetical protein
MLDINTHHNSTCLEDAIALDAYRSKGRRHCLSQRKKSQNALLNGVNEAQLPNAEDSLSALGIKQIKIDPRIMAAIRASLPICSALGLSVYDNLF